MNADFVPYELAAEPDKMGVWTFDREGDTKFETFPEALHDNLKAMVEQAKQDNDNG